MTTGILAAVCLSLTLGQGGGDVLHFNYRNHRIPVDVPVALRPEIRELLLYASADQGKSWSHVAGPIAPDKDHFAFFAPADGIYWLRVVQINRNGKQEPDDNGIRTGPPHMKLAIDTAKPVVRSLQVQRQDDDVYVNWEIQEDNLDAAGMRLEYHVKDMPADQWKMIPIQASHKGQTRFAPGSRQPLTVRLSVRDQAKNESFALKELDGTLVATAFTQGPVGPIGPVGPVGPITVPKEIETPKPIEFPKPVDTQKAPIFPPPVGIDSTVDKSLFNKPPVTPMPLPPKDNPGEKVIADSNLPPPPPVTPKVGGRDLGPAPFGGGPLKDMSFDAKPIASAQPTRKALPALQYVKQHQVMLEYELKRIGPAGIGGIEVWLTKDDGESWEAFAADEDVQSGTVNRRQSRKFDLRDGMDRPFADGVYGLSLVVKNRAGLGKKPRPGDAPEVRIEIDTQLPDAQLYQPIPDPQFPEQVLIKWTARDKNLAERPVHLEYAARADGEWLPIQLDLPNSGRYTNERVTGDFSWKVPQGTPVQVFLRLRVIDKAGNERVLVTPQPQFIDLTEPEGSLIGVHPPTKN